MEHNILPSDLESFGTLDDTPEDEENKTKEGKRHKVLLLDNKIKSTLPTPVFTQTGTKQKSGSKGDGQYT